MAAVAGMESVNRPHFQGQKSVHIESVALSAVYAALRGSFRQRWTMRAGDWLDIGHRCGPREAQVSDFSLKFGVRNQLALERLEVPN